MLAFALAFREIMAGPMMSRLLWPDAAVTSRDRNPGQLTPRVRYPCDHE
jgi:hypothetical protein